LVEQGEGLLGVVAEIGEDGRRRLGNPAVEKRAEDLTPEESAGGGTADKGAVVGARDDLKQEIHRQLPRRPSLGRACLASP
jgi:hypothetical protein